MSVVSAAAALFFAKGHLAQGLARHGAAMVEEVNTTPEDHLLEADEDEWVRALVESYRVEAPVVTSDAITMGESVPVQVDVSWDTSRIIRIRPAFVRGYRTPVHIPFSGDPDIFNFLPSSHILVRLRDPSVVAAGAEAVGKRSGSHHHLAATDERRSRSGIKLSLLGLGPSEGVECVVARTCGRRDHTRQQFLNEPPDRGLHTERIQAARLVQTRGHPHRPLHELSQRHRTASDIRSRSTAQRWVSDSGTFPRFLRTTGPRF